MNKHSTPHSFESYFRLQAVRWALIGLLITLLLAIPCALYSAKIASERQLHVTAKSAARAFRPMILQDNIRDAQYQMRKALDLKPEESAVVRAPDLSAIYPLAANDNTPRCQMADRYCWSPGLRSVSLLYPIYFDNQKPDVLYGYLELTMTPTVDWAVLGLLAVLLLIAFIGQAFGLSSAFRQSETNAQFSLLREISHDLKTPHSLLAKYFALHLDTVRTTGRVNAVEVAKVEATLKRMGDLIRQVRIVPTGKSGAAKSNKTLDTCDLAAEARLILEDFANDPDVAAKQISLSGTYGTPQSHAAISRVGFYRILENLLRNAVEAAAPETGSITVSITQPGNHPTLTVTDNGCGIATDISDKIFAFDFTTKASRGTGLGLGIVDKICKEFGATLELESAAGHGAKFTITFEPAAEAMRIKSYREVSHVQI